MTTGDKTLKNAFTTGSLTHFFQHAERLPFLRGITWAMIGTIYGVVYLLVRNLALGLDSPLAQAILPAVASTAFVALLYGSMRLTVIAAIYTATAIAITFLLLAPPVEISVLIASGCSTGAIVGAVFGWRVKDSNVGRADAKIIAGSVAGLLASISCLVPVLIGVPLPFHLEMLLLAPLCGLLYVGLTPHCVCRYSDILPPVVDGAIVGGGVGLLMAWLFWIMIGSMEGHLTHLDQTLVDHLIKQMPIATLSAAGGAFVVGVSRALLKVRWYDL